MASGGSNKRRRSALWEHFDEIASTTKVRCLHCSKELSYNGKSTASMRNHMRSKHPDNLVQARPSEANPGNNTTVLTRKEKIDNALVDMLVGLRWRLSAVNGEGFRGMMNTLDPSYEIPNQNELKALRDERHQKPKKKHPTWESSSDSD